MGQQQGRDEALKIIVTSMEIEIHLQPLFWVYDHFLKYKPERVVEKSESCCGGAERERVHFQSLFVLFPDKVLGAGKSLNKQGDIRWTGETGRRRRF